MKLLLTLLLLAFPGVAFAALETPMPAPVKEAVAKEKPTGNTVDLSSPIQRHMDAAKEYFKANNILEEHTDMYQKDNKELLSSVMERLPCVPASVLDKYKEIGRFPAEIFEKQYINRIISRLTEAELLDLAEFYKTHVGQFFIDWRMKNNGLNSSVIPVEDDFDQQVYAIYQPVVMKEHLALIELSHKGELLPEDTRKANKEEVIADIETLLQPYVDEQGRCPQ